MEKNEPIFKMRTRIWRYYEHYARHTLPWRHTKNPYRILVSEVMLQQTQVDRVVPYYRAFLKEFPTVRALAQAPLGDVLRAWQGLGYNRRAKFLHDTARAIVDRHRGRFPRAYDTLVSLPGVGTYTAKAVRTFAFNEPEVLIETNIRSVLIHHYYRDKAQVSDTELLHDIAILVRGQDPRTFYWALMDYGSYLKKKYPNPSRKSAQYTKQKSFKGSVRFVRGSVLRLLAEKPHTEVSLKKNIHDERVGTVLNTLQKEGLVRFSRGRFML